MTNDKPVSSIISAFVEDSTVISFSESGGGRYSNCEDSCRVLEKKQCYAESLEAVYSTTGRKMQRHYREHPARLVNRAIAELGTKPISWARGSVNGSAPSDSKLRSRYPKNWRKVKRQLAAALRSWAKLCHSLGAGIHWPAESIGKARTYRAIFKGTGVVVRRTCQSDSFVGVLKSIDPRAWICGRLHAGCVTKVETRENIKLAHKYAKQAREHGHTAVVCPKVLGTTKCGKCTACASPLVDIVIYPFHA